MTCWCNGSCPNIAGPQRWLQMGNRARALVQLRSALAHAPFCVEGNLMLANVLAYNNQGQAAEVHVDRAAHFGEPARIAFERAQVLRHQMRFDAALPAYFKALEMDPDNQLLCASFASAVEMTGNLDEAERLVDASRDRFPASAELRRVKAVIQYERKNYAGAIETLDHISDGDLHATEWLDLGRCREKLGDYGQAWQDWMKGKELCREKMNHKYNAVYFDKHFAALALSAQPPRPDFYRMAPITGGPQPVFVCGFPRSGTTLMETILSSHSAIVAGDELMGVNDVIEALPVWCKVRLPYPAAMLATSQGENTLVPELLRDLYLKGARQRIGWPPTTTKIRYFTDKMPLNDMHMPLIRILFPEARIFRMQRHPLDVMVSCMSHWMAHGGFFASSLEACAHHYKLTDDLFQAYTETPGNYHYKASTVLYEQLVADTAAVIQGACDLLGLPFQSRMLAPHKNKRQARTLSYNQVRKPITDSSIGRWKNFRRELAPAIEILKPIMEREGHDFL